MICELLNDAFERACFEDWVKQTNVVKKYGATLRKNRDGSYSDYRINDRWLAWKARAKLEKQHD